jgi:hypothetical protein
MGVLAFVTVKAVLRDYATLVANFSVSVPLPTLAVVNEREEQELADVF